MPTDLPIRRAPHEPPLRAEGFALPAARSLLAGAAVGIVLGLGTAAVLIALLIEACDGGICAP